MAIWYDEEYVVANLTNKTDYARAEIYKFNPVFVYLKFEYRYSFFFLPCFWKIEIENSVTRTFSIQLVILFPF